MGDAYGAPLEFFDLAWIRERFGPEGPDTLAYMYGREGSVTDDTQMTLFTVDGMIRSWVQGHLHGTSEPVDAVHRAYLRWLHTQGMTSEHPAFEERAVGWLDAVPELYAQRAPGNTCISGLQRPSRGGMDDIPNDSKGCGGAMRVALLGFWGDDAFALARDTTVLTHGHPSGYLAAGFTADVVRRIDQGATLEEAARGSLDALRAHEGHDETSAALHAAFELAGEGSATAEQLETLGEGWVAEEAVAIALYAALAAPDVKTAIRVAGVHSGDSDSTAAIAGAWLGAAYGIQALPSAWVETVEMREAIEQLADDWASIVEARDDDELARRLASRYPQP